MTTTKTDRALTLRNCDDSGDWYAIEWAEHDGRHWLQAMPDVGPGVMGYTHSGRVGDADIEGTADEMLAIAEAIERRAAISFKRCSVRFDGQQFAMCSPRNSMKDTFISCEQAAHLAREIRRVAAKDA